MLNVKQLGKIEIRRFDQGCLGNQGQNKKFKLLWVYAAVLFNLYFTVTIMEVLHGGILPPKCKQNGGIRLPPFLNI